MGDGTGAGTGTRAETETGSGREMGAPGTTRSLGALAAVLGLVAAVRLLPLSSVYRNGDVVLSSNDPYYYRYWVEQVSAAATGPVDPALFADLPRAVATGEPLTVVTLGWVTNILGGGSAASGAVLAWYPVVSALVTGVLVYLLAVRLTADPRVGLAAVGLFGVIPGHAFRTGLGFADHHAFDYPWLVLTALALVVLLARRPDGDAHARPWVAAGALGIGVADQTLAWDAGPLLLVPLAASIAVVAPIELRRGRRATAILTPVAGGLALATLLVGFAHVALGWQTAVVAATPLLLLVGTVGVLLAAAVAERTDHPARVLVAVEGAVLVGGLLVLPAVPLLARALDRGLARLFGTTGVAEAVSVVDQFGVVFGPLIMLGFAPLLGVPVMVWALGRAVHRNEAAWAVVAVYAWYFLALAFVQRRFTGELAPFIAVFGGVGFLTLASWFDLAREPVPLRGDDGTRPTAESGDPELELPGRRRLTVLGAMALVGVGFPTLYTSVIHSRAAIDASTYRAATWMREHAAARGWTYPESYVFSEWGRNRMYNYFVNGESRSYGYAQERYGEFILSSDAERWYERLRERAGYVVTRSLGADLSPSRLHRRLHGALGSADDAGPGVGHYRAMYASLDGSVKVFTLVPGATLVGETDAARVTVETEFQLTVPFGTGSEWASTRQTYARRADAGSGGDAETGTGTGTGTGDAEGGRFEVTVAHPGTYTVRDAEGDRRGRVEVPEWAVRNGERIEVSFRGD